MGSKKVLCTFLWLFLTRGWVLIPNPGYPTYRAVSKLLGAEVLNYNLSEENNWYPKMDDLESLNQKISN